MKIVIIGSGIGGLSTYLFLKKHLKQSDHEIVIYDAYDVHKLSMDSKPIVDPTRPNEPIFTPAAIGNAIGISKNGLAVLGRMAEDGRVLKEMQRRGHPVKQWKMSTARGWDVVDVNMTAMEDEGSLFESVMIARQTAWEILRDEVLQIDAHAVVTKRVDSVTLSECSKGRASITFVDGSHDEADLLIGADGLRSCVRKAMFQNSTDTEARSWLDGVLKRPAKAKDYITPHYEGLTGLGGFIPSSVLKDKGHAPGTMSIVFGPNGFFGCGYLTSDVNFDPTTIKEGAQAEPGDVASWWGTFSSATDQPFPVNKETNPSSKQSFDREAAKKSLLKRYSWWQQPVVQGVLEYVEQHGVEHFYPTYTTPELPTWQQHGKVVLVGDAAHALQPSSGQGACQALEDAESLALLLKHYLETASSTKQATTQALTKFVEIRKPRLRGIYEQSQKMSSMKTDVGPVTEMVMYFVLWLMTKLKTWDKYNEALMRYDVPSEVQKMINSD